MSTPYITEFPLPHSHIPPLDKATVQFALRLAPNRCPSINDSEREIWMNAGARRLAERLETILFKQEHQNVPV